MIKKANRHVCQLTLSDDVKNFIFAKAERNNTSFSREVRSLCMNDYAKHCKFKLNTQNIDDKKLNCEDKQLYVRIPTYLYEFFKELSEVKCTSLTDEFKTVLFEKYDEYKEGLTSIEKRNDIIIESKTKVATDDDFENALTLTQRKFLDSLPMSNDLWTKSVDKAKRIIKRIPKKIGLSLVFKENECKEPFRNALYVDYRGVHEVFLSFLDYKSWLDKTFVKRDF